MKFLSIIFRVGSPTSFGEWNNAVIFKCKLVIPKELIPSGSFHRGNLLDPMYTLDPSRSNEIDLHLVHKFS